MTKQRQIAIALYAVLDVLAIAAFSLWQMEMNLSQRAVRHPPSITVFLWWTAIFAFPLALLLAVIMTRRHVSSRPLKAFFSVSQGLVGLTWAFFTWALIVSIGISPD